MTNDYESQIGFDLNSIIIYVTFFSVSFLLCYLSEKHFKHKKNVEGFICASASVFVLCILAAFRATTVGGDIMVYLIPNYERVVNGCSFSEYYGIASTQMEGLFSLVVYFFAKFGNIQLLFFTIEMLTIVPVYLVLYQNRKTGSITMGYVVYVFLFYNFSLSGMRQAIATSFMLLAMYNLLDRKYLKAVILSVVASLFHKGSIIALMVVIVLFIFYRRKSFKIIIGVFAIMLVAFFIFYNQLTDVLAKALWKINPRYSYYIRKYISDNIQWNHIPNTEIITKFVIVLLCAFFGYYKKNNRNMFLLILSFIGRYFVLLNARMYESLRIAYYFDSFEILLVSNTVNQQKKYSNKIWLGILFIGLAFFYWLYFIMYIGGYRTNIYKFI